MNPWNRAEVEAIVADYFDMLCQELKGRPYSKTAHRLRLTQKLPQRNAGAIQKKHQTLSAVLLAMGLPHIRGYKPLDNYQTILIDAVDRHLEKHPVVVNYFMDYALRPLSVPMQRGLFPKVTVVEAPRLHGAESIGKKRLLRRVMKKYHFIAAEASNTLLRQAAEYFVLDLEKARLRAEGASEMVDRVRLAPEHQIPGSAYDILSFEADGKKRYIKVKPTACDMRFPFIVSGAELTFSAAHPDAYFLYRLFHFPENARLFILNGRLYDWVRLMPESFTARFE